MLLLLFLNWSSVDSVILPSSVSPLSWRSSLTMTKKLCAGLLRLDLQLNVSASRTHHSKVESTFLVWQHDFPPVIIVSLTCVCWSVSVFVHFHVCCWFYIIWSERSKRRDLLCELRYLLLSSCCTPQISSHHAPCRLDFLTFFFHTLHGQPPHLSLVHAPTLHPYYLQWKASVRDKYCNNPALLSPLHTLSLSLSLFFFLIAVFGCLQQCRGSWTGLSWKWRRRGRYVGKLNHPC